jgi:GTPase SAR1 family protein
MKSKQDWLDYHSSLKNACDGMKLSRTLLSALDEERSKIDEFELIVPLVGGFNAGKSSLLNAVLDFEYLPVNITPETSIAAEMRHGKICKVIAYSQNGTSTEFSIDKVGTIDTDKFDYIQVYSDSPFFERHPNTVIVDMPGLDSNILSHNKALMRYLPRAKAAIVLTDIMEGAVKKSVLSYLEEFGYFGSKIALLASKADLKPETEVVQVVNGLSRTVKTTFGDSAFVGQVSAHDGDCIAFHDALDCFAYESFLAEEAKLAIEESAAIIENAARREVKLVFADQEKVDRLIAELEKKKTDYTRLVEQETRALKSKFTHQVKNEIVSRIRIALESNVPHLASLAKAGGNAFSAEVASIIKRELTAGFEQYVVREIDSSLEHLSNELLGSDGMDEDFFGNLLSSTNQAAAGLTKMAEVLGKTTKLAKLSQVLLAITFVLTSFLAPILELVILLLPGLAKFMGGSLENKIRSEVIPQTMAKIEPEIASQLLEVLNDYLIKLEETFQSNVALIEESLQKHRLQKQQTTEEAENEKSRLLDIAQKVQSIAATATA